MTGAEMPPRVAAEADQDRAALRELVEAARHHTDALACEFPGTCVGGVVLDVVDELDDVKRQGLLHLAIAELAVLGYGLPVHLTDAALAALDVPGGGDDDRDR
ncbi:hypothetical protein [Micromonospora tarensis]|uniref:Uncharacterized protein n=1 Tax=Micromonospora tarensis TaxID=2806100 RepID=A0ABS1YCP5_9ACTN|nr:hypothetical protein [Micromonospora tarensis]MBM0275130.1 hypothetical protein [Micromonospora tarensis]